MKPLIRWAMKFVVIIFFLTMWPGCNATPMAIQPRSGLPRVDELPKAAHEGDEATVRSLLGKGASPDVKDRWGYTPLQLAAWEEHMGVVRLLIAHGANVNAAGACGVTPLHMAAAGGSVEIVALLLEKGAHVNARPTDGRWKGWSALHVAYDEKQGDIAELLLAHGADERGEGKVWLPRATSLRDSEESDESTSIIASSPNKEKVPSLTTAVIEGETDTVKRLLHEGADVNVKEKDGPTLLHKVRDAGIAKLLIAAGADLKAIDTYGRTPLHIAAEEGLDDVVALLLENGADTKAKMGWWGFTPIISAAQRGHRTTVDLLLAKRCSSKLCIAAALPDADWVETLLAQGEDLNVRGDLGETPLHWCARRGDRGLARLFLAKGVDVNSRDSHGMTPLFWAVVGLEPEMLAFLLENGADVDARDNNGSTILLTVLTFSGRKIEEVSVLIKHGADVHAKNKKGETPYELMKDDEELMALLKEREEKD